jgi:NitT/TauT family transport system substrate-binding protein
MRSRCDTHAWRGAGSAPLSRRELIQRSAAGALMVGLSGGALGASLAQAGGTIVRAPYGSGFCSLALFLAHARQIAAEDGVVLELVATPTFADHITFIGAGAVDVSITPYTSVIALHAAGAAVKIVAGGGIEGCGIVAQPGLDAPEKLRGTTLGTFQMDSLEVMAYDWLRAHDIGFDQITVRYMGSTPEAVEAFKAGALDWVCTIEPYVTALARDVAGAHVLSRGRDIYGAGYPDCVLTAQRAILERNPSAVKAVIKALMTAQHAFETEREQVLSELVGPYYKTSMENARIGVDHQPVKVDARDQADFILDRTDTLREMGYIAANPGRDLLDWTLLEEVIAENRSLWDRLERKSTVSL